MYTEAITVNAPEQQGNIQTYMYVANFLMEEGSNWENEKGDDYLLLLFIYEII